MFLLSAFSAESKKEKNSLRTLRLCGDYKLSNYNTIPYLRIRVLSEILVIAHSTFRLFFGRHSFFYELSDGFVFFNTVEYESNPACVMRLSLINMGHNTFEMYGSII